MEFPLLTLLLFLPLAGVVLMQLVSGSAKSSCRMVALWFSLMTFGVSLVLPALYDERAGGLQLFDKASWIPSLGINYTIAIDGISLWLVLLTTLTVPIVILASWRSVDKSVKSFHVCLLVLETAVIGAFVAQNLILFYLFWEAMLVPMALLIGIWGGGRRIYSAFKFFLFTAAGSLPMLLAIIYMWWQAGPNGAGGGVASFDLDVLAAYWSNVEDVSLLSSRWWCFWAFALAFAVKIPLFPVHVWLPDAHSDAPTAGSVILAGVLLKMGIYGYIRFGIPLFPDEVMNYSPLFQVVGVIGIIYGALMAMAQTDIKRLIAYSSISHLGFCVLGLFALTERAVVGSVFQMLAHGISTGALFLLVGVIYDRRHTREISAYGGLANVMPVYARVFLIATLASIALPLTVGFVGEFLILQGSWQWAMQCFTADGEGLVLGLFGTFSLDMRWIPAVCVVLATSGVILGAIYMLRLYQRMFWGEVTNKENEGLEDLTPRESVVLWPLVLLIFVMGIVPGPFLAEIHPTVQQLLEPFAGLLGR